MEGSPWFDYRGAANLQGRDALADCLGVFPQDPLLVQEAAVLAVPGWLEEAVVQDILQGLVERAQDALLGRPHCGVRVETHAFLVGDGGQMDTALSGGMNNTTSATKKRCADKEDGSTIALRTTSTRLITLCRDSRMNYHGI